jgi:plasmid stability protein
MGQVLIRKLNEETLDGYRRAAKAKGSSLEAELRALIEANRPAPEKDVGALVALSKRLRALTPPSARHHDSTAWIRWDRDTDHGRRPEDGRWPDDDQAGDAAGR